MIDDSTQTEEAQDDGPQDVSANLAFVRALVSEGGRAQMSGGTLFFIAGIAYGLQCMVQWLGLSGLVPLGKIGNLAAAILPTVIFLGAMSYVMWRDRKAGPKGVATRALNAAFGSAGLANLFMVFVFGFNAIRQHSIAVWLFYPAVVCAFQGAVWYVAYMIRKKLWLAGVSAGWFVTTVALGLLIDSPYYVLVLGVALMVLMGGSGYTMMSLAKKNA